MGVTVHVLKKKAYFKGSMDYALHYTSQNLYYVTLPYLRSHTVEYTSNLSSANLI